MQREANPLEKETTSTLIRRLLTECLTKFSLMDYSHKINWSEKHNACYAKLTEEREARSKQK